MFCMVCFFKYQQLTFTLVQALADAEYGVIAEAVRFLSTVCRERQIRKPSVLAAARKVSRPVRALLCTTTDAADR